jgi:hypothetical protein
VSPPQREFLDQVTAGLDLVVVGHQLLEADGEEEHVGVEFDRAEGVELVLDEL